MKITTISYQRTIPTGPYENVKIGGEATVDADETPEDAMKELSAWVKKCYDGMNTEEMRGITERVIQTSKPKLSQDEELIQQINTCTDPLVLASYKLIVKSKPALQEAYDAQLQKITA
jgi:hypothetical protein